MSALGLPWGDWQFYVTTALAGGGVLLVLRRLIPAKSRGLDAPPCSHCASGGCAPAKPETKSRLRVVA